MQTVFNKLLALLQIQMFTLCELKLNIVSSLVKEQFQYPRTFHVVPTQMCVCVCDWLQIYAMFNYY